MGPVHISARADYAVRAMAELAVAPPEEFLSVEVLAARQGLPPAFLEAILSTLRRAGLVTSRRGSAGGYRLAAAAEEISVADVLRAVDGPLATVRGLRPEDTAYVGAAAALPQVWVATRAAVRGVLESISVADLVADQMPKRVRALLDSPQAWLAHRG